MRWWDAGFVCCIGRELVQGHNSWKAAVYSRGEAWFERESMLTSVAAM